MPPARTDEGAGDSTEVPLDAEPASVPLARARVRDFLGAHLLADDAELVTAELVTNAVLHAFGPITLSLRCEPGGSVIVAVADGSEAPPIEGAGDVQGFTGRGLQLVSTLSVAWGVAPAASGKTVWARIGDGAAQALGGDDQGDFDLDAFLKAWDEPSHGATAYEVVVGDVPTDMLVAAKAQVDNVVRELTLAIALDDERTAALSRLVGVMTGGFADARRQIKQQATQAAARGNAFTHLVLSLEGDAADAAEEYLAALDEIDRHARAARLLSLETPPVHAVFRRWYIGVIVDSLRAAVKGQPAPRFPSYLSALEDAVTELAPLRDAVSQLEGLRDVASALAAAVTTEDVAHTVVAAAVGALRADAARLYELEGDALVVRAAIGGEVDPGAYAAVPLDADLPGPLAVRTGQAVVARTTAELVDQFGALRGLYDDDRSLLVAPLIAGGTTLGVLALTFRGEAAIPEAVQRAVLAAVADIAAQALSRATTTARMGASLRRFEFLAEASVILASLRSRAEVLQAIADLAVPRLADWCVVELLDEGQLTAVAVAHVDDEKSGWARAMAARYPVDMTANAASPKVVRTGESELISHISDELLTAVARDDEHLRILRTVGMSSALVVPMMARDAPLGAITLIRADAAARYDHDDQVIAEDLAHRAALAVENSR